MINIGQYIEELINWMMIHFSAFFDALNLGIGSFINGFQHILFGIPSCQQHHCCNGVAGMDEGRARGGGFHPFRVAAYLRYGLLGGHHADIGTGTVIDLSRPYRGGAHRGVDGKQ